MSDDSDDSSSEDEVPQQIRPGMYGGKRPAGKRPRQAGKRPAKAPRVGGVGGKAPRRVAGKAPRVGGKAPRGKAPRGMSRPAADSDDSDDDSGSDEDSDDEDDIVSRDLCLLSSGLASTERRASTAGG